MIDTDHFCQNMGPKNFYVDNKDYVDDTGAFMQVLNWIWGICEGKKLPQFLASKGPLQVPNPAKSPWHTAEKWHQLISIHEPFTWALFCLQQSLIQTETWLFGSLQTAVLSPLYTHNCWCMKRCHSHTILSCEDSIQKVAYT